ncbi:MAG: hypothetical protein KKG14_08955 [Alphaproteobacteria bacterium]|nr:hypothetical protein [Alphaproteobacteria bacterium]MBU1795840.1 hypothetical protein [Alphaproteobacteria bacterium]MBU2270221.1 hypothetical protein [Alphaproteobacteria bacterium]MBU2418815.1 hypothetical protein [Alphaproteobacteria bacterium]
MFETIYSQLGGVLTVLVMAFVFLKGDEPERVGGAAFVLIVLAGMMIPERSDPNIEAWGRMGLDAILLAVFAGLAWHSRRAWPVWAASFQALIVTGHLLVLAKLQPPIDAFAAVNNLSNYGLLLALAVGTFWAWQERRASGMGADVARPPVP